MFPRLQFAPSGVAVSSLRHSVPARILLAIVLLCPGLVCAQQPSPGTVGRVEGLDVSVEGGAPAGGGTAASAPSIFVENGSVVTVHSGQARLMLSTGGEIQICGPAKFTLLQSGGAITLALNFGRVRIQLPAATILRIFTPAVVATPLGIGSGLRDITIGLDLNDVLCVLATSGAIRLEQQFTGEVLDIPQAGEFFLAGGKLVPAAGASGSCRCAEMQPRVASPLPPPIPEMGLTSQTNHSPPAPQPAPPTTAAVQAPPPEPPVEFSVPAHANEAHPLPPAEKSAAPTPPPASFPEYKIIMPPLTFSAASPDPPPDPSPEMVLLVRVARDDPEWEFTGRVEAPRLEEVAQHTPSPRRQPRASKNPQKKKGGFWAALKRIFIGSGT
jgi:hypothetical protein